MHKDYKRIRPLSKGKEQVRFLNARLRMNINSKNERLFNPDFMIDKSLKAEFLIQVSGFSFKVRVIMGISGHYVEFPKEMTPSDRMKTKLTNAVLGQYAKELAFNLPSRAEVTV